MTCKTAIHLRINQCYLGRQKRKLFGLLYLQTVFFCVWEILSTQGMPHVLSFWEKCRITETFKPQDNSNFVIKTFTSNKHGSKMVLKGF